MRPGRAESERGFALITALWATMILAMIATVTLATMRTSALATNTRVKRAELEAIADGALNLMLLSLSSPTARAPLGDAPLSVDFSNHVVRVWLSDEAGKVDLNAAPGDLLRRLLMAHGQDGDAAQALADCIMDWREPGTGKRLNGAKGPEYRAAGLTYGPREGPFESVDEIKLVLGMPPKLFDDIRPALTVYSYSPTVDASVAPEAALVALPGMDDAEVGRVLAARRRRGADDTDGQAPIIIDARGSAGRVFTIMAQARDPDGLMVARRVVARLSALPNGRALVYQWN